jgi:hypothetical protein
LEGLDEVAGERPASGTWETSLVIDGSTEVAQLLGMLFEVPAVQGAGLLNSSFVSSVQPGLHAVASEC